MSLIFTHLQTSKTQLKDLKALGGGEFGFIVLLSAADQWEQYLPVSQQTSNYCNQALVTQDHQISRYNDIFLIEDN